MDYRSTSPTDNGFDGEEDEFDAMHDFVQTLMERSGPNDLLDSLLMIANISETRALNLSAHNKGLSTWYQKMSVLMRGALELMNEPNGAKPQAKLENPMLYYPNPMHSH